MKTVTTKDDTLRLALEFAMDVRKHGETRQACMAIAVDAAIREALEQPQPDSKDCDGQCGNGAYCGACPKWQNMLTAQEAWDAAGGNPEIRPTKQEALTFLRVTSEVADEVSTEPPQQERAIRYDEWAAHEYTRVLNETIEGLTRKLAAYTQQPQQEPVAWYEMEGSEAHLYWRDGSGADVYDHITHYQKDRHGVGVFPLYTAPPRREWVKLTDEQISAVDWKTNETLHDFARAIEARLKERNA